MAAYISRTTATSFTSQQKFTASMWVKGDTPPPADVYWWSIGSSGAHITIYAASNGKINVIGAGPSSAWYQYSNIALKDPAAWYHVLISVDTTQSVANDRIKLYINGTLYADDSYWASRSYPAEDDELTGLVSGKIQYIGSNYGASGEEWEGLMSHVHYCDGYNYAASDFGETDSTSGIWKIKTSPSVTYGNNGYFLKMEDRTNLDLDSGTNAFTFTTTGTLTATYDNPSNNFATYNALQNVPSTTLSNGNTTIVNDSSAFIRPMLSTLGASSGKFYVEFKAVTASSASRIGICAMDKFVLTEYTGVNALSYGYIADGTVANNNSTTISGLSSYTSGDIIGVYIDLDNNFLYFAKNGVLENSGVPTSGATGTGGQAITANNTYGFHITVANSGSYKTSVNFGNGYFGTTAVSSANADDAGIGAMEYDVPAGYYCLCTKNIKAYG